MNITWDHIYLAIQIVVTIQLILGIILNTIEFKTRNLLLAYLCFLVVYTYNVFFLYPSYSKYAHKFLHLIGSYIYFGPTFYLYLKSLTGKLGKREIFKHYSIPFTICLTYNLSGFSLYSVFIYVFLIGYILASVPLYHNVKTLLSGALKKRFLWFIFIHLLYLVLDTPMIILEDLAIAEISIAEKLYPSVNHFFYTYLHFPLLFFHFFILSLYAITEIPRFKKFFLSKTLKDSGIGDQQTLELKSQMTELFEKEKIFLNPSLNLEKLSVKMNLEKSLISKFLKETYNKGFNDFINEHRVNEFKRILVNPKYKNYDLVGLANESGFKSKATFYRVFKEIEGLTPNQYKKTLQN